MSEHEKKEMAEKKIGFEVVKVRGNVSYTINVYKTRAAAISVRLALASVDLDNADDGGVCSYEVRQTRIY